MFEGKNFLVTGCSRGLGLEITRKMLEDGANVYGISRSSTEEIDKLGNRFKSSLKFLEFNLENCADIETIIFKEWLTNRVPLHGLVNNAAIAYDDLITNLRLVELEKLFKINVYSPFVLTRLAIRNMIFNRLKGSLVNISSVSAHTGYKGLSMYAGTKAALEGFTINAAREWGERGIRCNSVVVGFMETEMSSTLTTEQKNRIYQRTCLKSATSLESVAATVAFLLSDSSASITGQNIHVDSGTI